MALKTTTLHIDGMTCQGCVGSVTRALSAVSGVMDVTVSFDDKCAAVQYDGTQTTPEALVTTIENAGFDARISEAS